MSASPGLIVQTQAHDAGTLRVACIIDTMRPGGAERVCARLAEGVRADGGTAFVYELTPNAARESRFAVIWRLLRWLRRHRINVVHAHNSAALVYAFGPAKLLGLPVVVTRHGSLFGARPRLVRWADRLLPSADCVVVVADALRTALPAGVRPHRTVHLPNGVPTRRANRDDGRARLHALTGVSAPAEWIVNVGTVSPEKNQPGIVRAFGRAAGDRPTAHLALIGAVRCERTLAETRRTADAAGLRERVHLVGQQDDVPTLLAGADAFALGSRTEAMPMALLEAMVQGCPITATRVGDVPRMIRDEREGLLVPAGDDAALGAALVRLLNDGALGRRIGEAARVRACEAYSEDRMVREHVRLYARLLGDRHDGA